jgi:hypothetical protein
MKSQTIFLAVATVLIMGGLAGAQAVGQYTGAVSLVNVTVSPNTIVAGQNVTVRFQLYNSYNYWVYGTTLQPTGEYPLLNVSPLKSEIIGTLNPGANSAYYSYTVHIPSTTPAGSYTLLLTATYLIYSTTSTQISTSSMPVSFYVQANPSIKVMASNPEPSTLYSGYNQTIGLLVENNGYGTARNVTLTVNSSPGLSVLSSVRSFFISNLTAGSSQSEPILLSANGTGTPYLIVNATYYSALLNKRFSSIQRINLSVAPSAQFSIDSEGPSPGIGATDVPVNFRITNTGTSPAEQLQLNLQTPYPVTPVASTAYVNNLQPGASTNVTFLVSIDSQGVPGNYPVTLYEQWKQPSGSVNQQFTGSDNYYIDIGQANPTASYETDAAIIIVIIVIIAMVFRRRSAKSRKKEKK